MKKRCITILGSTGSIGLNTVNVIKANNHLFDVYALSGNSQLELLFDQCIELNPKYAVVVTEKSANRLKEKLIEHGSKTSVMFGLDGFIQVSTSNEVDVIMSAIVGSEGLLPTFSAISSGKTVLLANKESLVMAGNLMIAEARKSGAVILPVDSEHNAIFQCIHQTHDLAEKKSISRLTLTASGGPFRDTNESDLKSVTPQDACLHPTWNMGKKISIDSATLMNKGLELIEARWLFDCNLEKLRVVIHPQSIVHSFVHFFDGSVMAQLGQPDMRIPIAFCLGWPQRIASGSEELDISQIKKLEFLEPNRKKFRSLDLAESCLEIGMNSAIYLNSANEVAVDAFLKRKIKFTTITHIVSEILEKANFHEPESIADVKDTDFEARAMAFQSLKKWNSR